MRLRVNGSESVVAGVIVRDGALIFRSGDATVEVTFTEIERSRLAELLEDRPRDAAPIFDDQRTADGACPLVQSKPSDTTEVPDTQPESPPATKRGRVSEEVKTEIIRRVAAGEKQKDLAAEFGLDKRSVSDLVCSATSRPP